MLVDLCVGVWTAKRYSSTVSVQQAVKRVVLCSQSMCAAGV